MLGDVRSSVFLHLASFQILRCTDTLGGVRGALSGAVMGAFGCTIAQLAVNELEVTRLKFVSRKLKASPRPAPVESKPAEPQNVPPFLDKVARLFGLQRMSNEEYLTKLRKERDAALKRIAILENEDREQTWASVVEEANQGSGSTSSEA